MRWLLPTAIVLIIIGILGLVVVNYYAFAPDEPGNIREPFRGPYDGRFRGPGGTFSPADFASNGEQIFFTGVSSRDTITTTSGPFWFRMHGGGCATCHGPDGRGGRVIMMGSFEAPNITYDVLTGKAPGEEEHEPFTDSLIKRAITRGLHADGERLNSNMPRWRMSDRDLDDVIDYLKTLEP